MAYVVDITFRIDIKPQPPAQSAAQAAAKPAAQAANDVHVPGVHLPDGFYPVWVSPRRVVGRYVAVYEDDVGWDIGKIVKHAQDSWYRIKFDKAREFTENVHLKGVRYYSGDGAPREGNWIIVNPFES